MANEFRLPDIGEGLTDAEIVAWHVGVGDNVAVDQVLVEVETAKSVVDITSPFGGTLLFHGGDPGDEIQVGAVLFVIGEPGEHWTPDAESEPVEPTPAASALRRPEAAESVRAVPAVRKLARESGIDLSAVTGTGPGGAITKSDVLAAGDGLATERVAMSRMRRTIAEHMARSWREIPHVTVQADVDAGRFLEAYRVHRERSEMAIPLEALLAQAVLPLLTEFPEFNATVEDGTVVLKRHYDLGVAVHTDDGLIVVVVRAADDLSLAALSESIVRLAASAKQRTIAPADIIGQTFTLSNIGALGGGHGTPIIPWGTTAILSLGRARDMPVVRGGEVTVAPIAPLDLSYDHRLIDGAVGQQFLGALVAAIEAFDVPD
jgi:pyruvate dehydrogenase E2 component (dihydrolipoamide acetyltransferase)